MFIGRMEISRVGYIGNGYGKADPSKPFIAKIEVFGVNSKTELVLSEDMSRRVVEVIAEEIAAAGRATAEALTAEALTVAVLPAPEAEAELAEVPF